MKPKIFIDPEKCSPHRNPDPRTCRSFPFVPDVMEIIRVCEECGDNYIALTLKGMLWTTGLCIPCSEIQCKQNEDEETKGSLEKRRSNFKEKCPEKYLNFQKEKLPNIESYTKVISWNPGGLGMILCGNSERGKTRSAWRLLNRLYVANSIPFEAITELHFSHEVAKFGKSEALSEWIKKLCKIQVLFIDDLGKCVMTERVSSELFYVLEERMSHNKPIIATMQIDVDSYSTKISTRSGKDMAEAIMNRLKSNCEIINF